MNEPIEFYTTAWDYYHYNNTIINHRYLGIQIFGRTEDSSEVYLRVNNYKIKFYIKIPDEFFHDGEDDLEYGGVEEENEDDEEEEDEDEDNDKDEIYGQDDFFNNEKKFIKKEIIIGLNKNSFIKSSFSKNVKKRILSTISKIKHSLSICGLTWNKNNDYKNKKNSKKKIDDNEKNKTKNNDEKINTRFIEKLDNETKRFTEKNLIDYNLVKKTNYFGFNKEKEYLELVFDNYEAVIFTNSMFNNKICKIKDPTNKYRNYISAKFVTFNTQLKPHNKFVSDSNFNAHGWMRIEKYKITKESYAKYSLVCQYEDITKVTKEKQIPKLIIASYDGEMINPDDRRFPSPKSKTNAVANISIVVYYHNESIPFEIHTFILAKSDVDKMFNKKQNVNYHFFEKEPDLLLGFADCISKIRPDFLIGYNNFKFDDKYFHKRLKYFEKNEEYSNLIDKFYDKLSRIRIRKLIKLGILDYSTSYLEKKGLKSAAYGSNLFHKFKIPGINSIDLFSEIIKNFRLSDNKLDGAAAYFISNSVLDIDFSEIDQDKNIGKIKILSTKNEALEIGSYIQLIAKKDHSATSIGIGKRSKYLVDGIEIVGNKYQITVRVNDSNEMEILKEFKSNGFEGRGTELKWAFTKDEIDYSEITKAFVDNDSKKISIVVDYCIQDSKLPHLIILRKNIIISSLQQSNVFYLPVNFLFTHGQNCRGLSLLSHKISKTNYIIPNLVKEESSKYEGAFVLKPNLGLHNEPVATLDFSSLYPRCMCEKNTTHELYVTVDWYEKNKKILDKKWYVHDNQIINTDNSVGRRHIFLQEIVDIETIEKELAIFRKEMEIEYKDEDIEKRNQLVESRVKNEKIIRYNQIKKDNKIIYVKYGILTETLMYLLIHRNFVKGLMKGTKDPNMIANYDALQNALKIAANSIYGSTGFSKSSLYMLPISELTTFTGRMRLTRVQEIVKSNFKDADIVYGDTDSVFVKFKNVPFEIEQEFPSLPIEEKRTKELEKTITYANKLVDIINNLLPSPHCIVIDKIIYPLLLLSKKKYLGLKWLVDNIKNPEYLSMGDLGKKRNYAEIAKTIYRLTIDCMIYDYDVIKSAKSCQVALLKMINGEYPKESFHISINLNKDIADYDNVERVAHASLANRMAIRDPNNPPTANTRITYMFFRKEKELNDKKGQMIEEIGHFEKNNLKIDYYQYIDSQIEKALKKVLMLIFTEFAVNKLFQTVKDIAIAEMYGQKVNGKTFFQKYNVNGIVDYEKINLNIKWEEEKLSDVKPTVDVQPIYLNFNNSKFKKLINNKLKKKQSK